MHPIFFLISWLRQQSAPQVAAASKPGHAATRSAGDSVATEPNGAEALASDMLRPQSGIAKLIPEVFFVICCTSHTPVIFIAGTSG